MGSGGGGFSFGNPFSSLTDSLSRREDQRAKNAQQNLEEEQKRRIKKEEQDAQMAAMVNGVNGFVGGGKKNFRSSTLISGDLGMLNLPNNPMKNLLGR